MRRVQRSEVVDYVTYEEVRGDFREKVLAIKEVRRVQLAGVLTLLFENADTVRYQVQEMMRAEKMVREADILHELQTYNELLGGVGELGCTLLVAIDDPSERNEKLRAWLELPEHMYLRLDDGTRVRATFDERQRGDTRLSSVQYLKFGTGGRVPVAVGVDLPGLADEAALTQEQQAALRQDLETLPSRA